LYINSIELIGYCHIITNINFYDGYHGHHKKYIIYYIIEKLKRIDIYDSRHRFP
jgi:hypothetical protein